MKVSTPIAIIAVALALGAAARADDAKPAKNEAPRERVVVSTHGRATAPADEVELELVVSGASLEAAEAEKKQREKLARVVAALSGKDAPATDGDQKKKKRRDRDRDADRDEKKLTPEEEAVAAKAAALDVAVVEGATTAGVEARTNDQDQDENGNQKQRESQFRVATALHVTIKGVAQAPVAAVRLKVCELVDRAVAAGADAGLGTERSARPAIRFKVADAEALRLKAYGDAVAKARGRADEIARLVGRTARLVSVTEEDVTAERTGYTLNGEPAPTGLESVLALLGDRKEGGTPEKPGASPTTTVAIEIGLQTEFEMVPAPPSAK